jgi:hypothetical protein
MRLRSVLLLFSLFAAALVPLPAAAQSPCPHWDGDELHLAGRIGGADVVVYLDTGWPSREGPNGASGLVMDTARWHESEAGLVARIEGIDLAVAATSGKAAG